MVVQTSRDLREVMYLLMLVLDDPVESELSDHRNTSDKSHFIRHIFQGFYASSYM